MTASGAQTSYFYDDNNKLTSFVDAGGTTTFGYDSNGNTTSMVTPSTTWGYGYDPENRLVSVTGNAGYTAGYTYAPDALRLRIQESNAQYPDRWLQYDGVRPVLEGTLSGDTFTTVNKYVWEGESYYDPLVDALVGGSWRYYLYDGLGSTRQLMLHASPYTVTDTYSYEAFGNVLSSSGTTPNPYQYVGSLGYYRSGDPHLLHLGARYYMPEVGRFAETDLVRPTFQGYLYTSSQPVDYVDPEGLLELPGTWMPPGPILAGEWLCRCYRAGQDTAHLAQQLDATLGLEGGQNGPADAVRHCYWMCELTKKMGGLCAWLVGAGHEADNVRHLGPLDESAMDLYNNGVGRGIGRSRQKCKEGCLRALRKGRLHVMPRSKWL